MPIARWTRMTRFISTCLVVTAAAQFSVFNIAHRVQAGMPAKVSARASAQELLSPPVAPDELVDTVVSDWQAKAPPNNVVLRAVSMASETDGWAVGNTGAALRWNGSAWVAAPALGTGNLLGVDMLSANEGWIVGTDKIYKWDGTTWAQSTKPTGNPLRSVSMLNSNLGYTVGDNGTILKYDGSQWNFTQSPISDTNLSLTAVDMLAVDIGWAVGKKPDDSGNVMLRWNGSVWAQVSLPLTSPLNAVATISPVDAWAVGNSGVILHWNGGTWDPVPSPTTNTLTGLTMLSKNNGWAVGFGGTILRWDGNTWSARTSPISTDLFAVDAASNKTIETVGVSLLDYKPQATSSWQVMNKPAATTIRAMSLLSDNDGWAVGNDGAILHWQNGTWIAATSPVTANLTAVDVLSANDAWAVGTRHILHYTGTWNIVNNPTGVALRAVGMVSSTLGYAVGDGAKLLRYNGTSWNFTGNPITDTNISYNAIAMISGNDGWIVGGRVGDNSNAPQSVILRLVAGNWTVVTSPIQEPLYALSVVAANDVWAVGALGSVIHFDGVAWNPIPTTTSSTLNGVAMLSPTYGWAVGNSDTILRWDGITWSAVSGPNTKSIFAIAAPSSAVIVAGGEDALQYKQTTNATWQLLANQQTAPVNKALRGVSLVSSTEGWAVGNSGTLLRWNGSAWSDVAVPTSNNLIGVDMLNGSEGWAVGTNDILHFTAGNWVTVTKPTGAALRSVSVVAANNAWAVGDNGVTLNWDGSKWNFVTSPTTRTLSSVFMLSNIDGWAVGGNSGTPNTSVILRWNGSVWSPVNSPTTNPLNAVVMLSSNDGWAVGANGVIVHWDGVAWSKLTSPVSNGLNGIAMVSATSGWAVGNAGALIRWDGANWRSETNPASTGTLYAVAAASATEAAAVGEPILRYQTGPTAPLDKKTYLPFAAR